MTNAAQSALLKVIEEPPPKIYFFLCTTEPFKLLPTIRSRCTVLELRLLGLDDTRSLLAYAFSNKLSKEIAEAIHYKSGGHARDAVKMAEIALLTNVMSVDELSSRVGFGRSEVEGLFLSIMKERPDTRKIGTLTNIQDVDLVVQVMDNVLDVCLLEGHNLVVANYGEFLDKRLLRREHRITPQEQIFHFVGIYLKG
jgi:DNA polymerase III gamma/tau subunit